LRRRLLAWFADSARDLPWRRSRDPYLVWVSEIMLQQTRVATVVPYFERFVQAFPTVEALAAAEEKDVLRLWEGLGYYRRASQLHQAARIITAEHGGQFPRDAAALRRLPGIGRYTAGAILSIAFDLPEPILEANTTRLFSRLLAYRGDAASAGGQRLLWATAAAVLPKRGAGRFNQALMELGSEVCLARLPRCDACPVASLCRANAGGLQAEIPPPRPKRRLEAVREAVVLVCRRGRVLLLRHPPGRRWGGLWDFPRFEIRATQPAAIRRELVQKVRDLAGVLIRPGEHLRTIKHGVTRFRITLECYRAEFAATEDGQPSGAKIRWLRPAELDQYPLSATGRKMARLVQEQSERIRGAI
jgi:A/G-specific adenine glycosylase